MGSTIIQLQLPTGYSEDELRRHITRKAGCTDFSYRIDSQSLDARKKNRIHWVIRAVVTSDAVKGTLPAPEPPLTVPRLTTGKTAVVVGSGPAGMFAALVLQQAGIRTTLLERGNDVETRATGISTFERTGVFDPLNNYAFGEGGAGTFSDGKLTSRTKRISKEKTFILNEYVKAGGPEEIRYMTHPHLGSDNLRNIVTNMRRAFIEQGGDMRFGTMLTDLAVSGGTARSAVTADEELPADYVIIAPGHSAYETHRMLMARGVPYRTKNFALGCRVEHPQDLINRAQWDVPSLPGVKAAEYRLTHNAGNRGLPVYTFCMCPGGTVVPATAYAGANIVNGMSLYGRDGRFANAACVAGVHVDVLTGRTMTPKDALSWLQDLEKSFFARTGSYEAPFCTIQDFLNLRQKTDRVATSYPLGLVPAPLWEMLPKPASIALKAGLRNFCGKLHGFEKGIMLGLESKTSAPVQVVRDEQGRPAGFENLYVAGEGSGWAGGIVSSAADGIRAAMDILNRLS